MDSWSSRIVVVSILIICFLKLSHGSANVCLATWAVYDQRFSTGGTPQNIIDLASCLAFCRFSNDCIAVDFSTHPDSAVSPCWTHTDGNDLTEENLYSSNDLAQYVINRNCSNANSSGVENCQLTWERLTGKHSINADGKDYWTEYDCVTYCRLNADCVAADFDIGSSPPCWIHTSNDDLTPDNTYDDSSTAVQYRINRTCPAPVNSSFQLGQCAGYPMKTGNWCLSGEEIHIVKASYKNHPLCCYSRGTDDLLDVPDSVSLLELDIFLQSDDQYKRDIEACEGYNTCALTAKAFESSYINNNFCPTRIHATDYVSISYSCRPKGHSDPNTSTFTTSESPVVNPSLGTHLLTSSSSSASVSASTSSVSSQNSIIYISNQSSNRDALILGGFGVAFGGLAVITLIVIGVCWYLRCKRDNGDAIHMAMNPMYANNNGSVISDDSLNQNRNQFKGVSTTVIYPETDTISD